MGVSQTYRMAILCLGYALFFSTCPLGPLGTALLRQGTASWDAMLFTRLAFLVCSALCALAVSSSARASGKRRGLCMASAATVQGALLAANALGVGSWTVSAAAIASGLFAGPYQLCWSESLSGIYEKQGRAVSIAVYAVAFALSTLLTAATPLVQTDNAVGLAIALGSLVAAWALLEAGRRGGAGQPIPPDGGSAVPRIPIYAQSVLSGLGVAWALAFNLAVDLGFGGEANTEDTSAWAMLLVAYGTCQLAVVVAARTTRLGETHFGLLIRWTIVCTGIAWAFMPILAVYSPRFACAFCVMTFLMQCVIVVQFTIEACHEQAIPFPFMFARYARTFVLAACAGSLAFWAFKTYLAPWALCPLTAAVAISTSLLTVPMLPSRSSGAGTFVVDKLPEDETIDGRVNLAKQRLVSESGLTKREAEVLDLMLSGRTRDDIAQELEVSSWTVKNHCRSIYAKTGTHSAKELMGRIYRS